MRYTNNYNLPQSYCDLIESIMYDPRENDPKRIGITTLTDPPRIRILKLRHYDEIEQDVSEFIWAVLGNACHYILAKTKPEGRLIEQKFEHKIDDITIVGKLDLYEKTLQRIEDYKITGTYSVILGAKKEWEQQLNCYAWILRKNNIDAKELQINAILKDWQRIKTLQDKNYPKIPFHVTKIKLWSHQEQEDYVQERLMIHREVMNSDLSDFDLPLCSEEERWQKKDVFAVHKGKNKKALRLLNSEDEANKFIKDKKVKKGCIEFRKGEDRRCSDFCSVNKFCDYYCSNYKKK